MEKKNIQIRMGLMGVTLAALVGGFHALLFNHAPGLFQAPDADMSYAWFVPVYSAYVLWVERARIRAAAGVPSLRGLVFALPFLALGFIGVRGVQIRFEMIAFVGLLIAVAWAMFGGRLAKIVLFPALFLLFCLPLGSTLGDATERLQALASGVSYHVLKGLGADVVLEGHVVRSAAADGFATNVAVPCSGLRSLFALMALTAGYGYFNQPTWLRRGLLFLCSIPIAILGNVVRILTVCLVSNYVSKDFGAGTYHDASGFIVFLVAIALMLGVDKGITFVFRRLHVPPPAADAAPSAAPAVRHPYLIPVLTVVLVAGMMLLQAAAPKPEIVPEPALALRDVEGYVSQALELDEADRSIPARVEKRIYADGQGETFTVVLIVSGDSVSNRAIHRPEQCLDAANVRWTDKRIVEVDGRDWCFETLRNAGGAVTGGFAYTLFNQAGVHTASSFRHKLVDAWDRSVLNRVDRWVQVRVWTHATDDESLRRVVRKVREAIW
ncbi:MAG: exosortase/archaeosortase family protein [Kiritimatiellia bacterium]